MPEVISNTSPLQYLHQLDLLHLLPNFYGQVLIPRAVADELQTGLREGVKLPILSNHAWIQVRDVSMLPQPSPRNIHRGEAQVIALAVSLPNSLVLLDDAPARQHARVMGLRLTGTAGLLLRAKRDSKVVALKPLLDRLEILGFHLDEATRAGILKIAAE